MLENHGWTRRHALSVLLGGGAALAGDRAPVELIGESGARGPEQLAAEWKPVLAHTHNLRTGEMDFEEVKTALVEWCRRLGVRALGLGSPWEPVSRAAYLRYEGTDRDNYYGGRVQREPVMFRQQIGRLLDELNAKSHGATYFYQDNETPKTRLGHMWWFGYDYDAPAWHDYSQDRPLEYWSGETEREINAVTGEPHRRRSLLEIMAHQRQAGAVGVFAHPTSWWLDRNGKFIPNIASELALFLAVDGRIDGMAVVGYDACHRGYQRLWFHLLDTGAVVPGFAETDYALDRRETYKATTTLLNYMHLPGELNVRTIAAAAKAGSAFVSTGALLTATVDGVAMGAIVRTSAHRRHVLAIEGYPAPGDKAFSLVEIVGKGGKVLARREGWLGGRMEYRMAGASEAGYVVVRAYGEHDDANASSQHAIRHFAMTNPLYLHPHGFSVKPAVTRCTIEVPGDSSWLGGDLSWESAGGAPIAHTRVRPGTIRRTVPAGARVRLGKAGRQERRFYLAMENPQVEKLLTYLHRGEFRADYARLAGGEVPPEAFRLSEMRDALREFHYTLK